MFSVWQNSLFANSFSLKNIVVLRRICQAFGSTYFASRALQLKWELYDWVSIWAWGWGRVLLIINVRVRRVEAVGLRHAFLMLFRLYMDFQSLAYLRSKWENCSLSRHCRFCFTLGDRHSTFHTAEFCLGVLRQQIGGVLQLISKAHRRACNLAIGDPLLFCFKHPSNYSLFTAHYHRDVFLWFSFTRSLLCFSAFSHDPLLLLKLLIETKCFSANDFCWNRSNWSLLRCNWVWLCSSNLCWSWFSWTCVSLFWAYLCSCSFFSFSLFTHDALLLLELFGERHLSNRFFGYRRSWARGLQVYWNRIACLFSFSFFSHDALLLLELLG